MVRWGKISKYIILRTLQNTIIYLLISPLVRTCRTCDVHMTITMTIKNLRIPNLNIIASSGTALIAVAGFYFICVSMCKTTRFI